MILAYEPTQGVDVGSRFDIYKALRTRTDAGDGAARQVERPHRALRAVRSGAGHVARADHRGDPRRRARRAAHRRGDGARTRSVQGGAIAPGRRDAEEPLVERARRERAASTPARLAVRKVLRDARDKNKWRKIVKFRLWMPVALQVLLIAGAALLHHLAVPGLRQRAQHHDRSCSSRCPLIVAAMAQTHALLVGYLDLSVGGDDQPRGGHRLVPDRRRGLAARDPVRDRRHPRSAASPSAWSTPA